MKFTKTATLAAFAMGASLAMSTPALAQFVKSPSAVQPPENVLLDTDIRPGDNELRGTTNQSRSTVVFRSSTDNLLSGPQGQANITTMDGSDLGSLVFRLEDLSTFTSAEFNILASQSGTVTLTAFTGGTLTGGTLVNGFLVGADLVAGSTTNLFSQTFDISANGQNFFGFTSSTPITGIQITANTALISRIEQFRLGGIQAAGAVPEPATWAMMLFGFGAVGYSMRSRRRVGFKAIQAI